MFLWICKNARLVQKMYYEIDDEYVPLSGLISMIWISFNWIKKLLDNLFEN